MSDQGGPDPGTNVYRRETPTQRAKCVKTEAETGALQSWGPRKTPQGSSALPTCPHLDFVLQTSPELCGNNPGNACHVGVGAEKLKKTVQNR